MPLLPTSGVALCIAVVVLGFSTCASVVMATSGPLQKDTVSSTLRSPVVAKQWKFSLPESVLQQSFLFPGSTGRFKQVLQKLLLGETVRIGVLGGSVTSHVPGYFEMVGEWLVKAFPKATVIYRNGAIGATPSMYVEHFLANRLDPGVDLVMVEYAINNEFKMETLDYADMQSLERVVRKLLTGAYHSDTSNIKPAAVLMVNMWRCCRFVGDTLQLLDFTEHLGDHFNVIAQYYGLPAVAVRDGLYHEYLRAQGMFSNIKEAYPVKGKSMTHPSDLGHKYMADMVVYAFYVALAQLEHYGITPGDLDLIARPQPPPLVANEAFEAVVLGSWHAEAIQEIVSKKSDWNWGDDPPKSHKYGFDSRKPGARLVLELNTQVPSDLLLRHPLLGSASVWVKLGMLKSYEHMGIVQISCVSGCSCTSVAFDTNDADDLRSQTVIYSVEVTRSKRCVMELEVLEESTSKGHEHKVVLRGVAVAAHMDRPGQGVPGAQRTIPNVPDE